MKWIKICIVFLCLFVYAVGNYLLRHYVILPDFVALEQKEAKRRISSCVDAVERESFHLSQRTHDWSYWDDTYRFMEDRNEEYIKENFQWPTLHESGIDMIIICDLDGKVVARRIHHSSVKSPLDLYDTFPLERFPANYPLIQKEHVSDNPDLKGIVLTSLGPMVVASSSIFDGDGSGPARGTLIMGRFLSKEIIQTLIDQQKVDFRVGVPHTEKEKDIFRRIVTGEQLIEEIDNNTLLGCGLLSDINGTPSLLISARMSRDIMVRGRFTALLISIILFIATLFVVSGLLTWFAITSRAAVRRQAELLKYSDHLEEVVTERTEEVQSLANVLEMAQHVSGVGHFEWFPATGKVVGSDVYHRLFESTPESRSCFDDVLASVHPEDRDFFEKTLKSSIVAHTNYYHEYRVVVPSGIKHIITQGKFLYDSSGELSHLLGTVQDVTKQKELESEHALFERFANSSSQGFGMASLDGKISYMNPSLLSILGSSSGEEFEGKTFSQFYPEVLREQITTEVIPTLLENGGWKGELALFKTDGTVIPTFESFFLVKDEEGDPQYFADVITDISEQKATLEELKSAKQAAESANQAKSNFLANMSHEIRTPMNAIIGLSYLALRKANEPKQIDYLTKIHSSSNALLCIINDILDFSKIEAGMVIVENVSFDLPEMINQVIHVFSQSASDKNLDLMVDLSASVPHKLEGDPLRIRQILTNLIGNSVKFTVEGEIVVGVNVLEQVGGLVKLEFKVTDSGIGMSSDQCEHIFDAFSQADSSTTRRFGGTGLGLTITQNLVKLMNGEISVESELGKGSTFTFILTFGEGGHHSNMDGENELPDLSGMRILVVDDNETNIEVALGLLEETHCMTATASNGVEALEAIKATTFDLVLMDVQMPVMDGIEATKTIRTNEKNGEHLIIIAMTAGALQSDRVRSIESGMDEHISKPLVPELLYAELLKWKQGETTGFLG